MDADLRAEALALCEEWEKAQLHHPWCEIRCGSEEAAGGPLRCTCGHAHRLEVIGCGLAAALRACLASPAASAPAPTPLTGIVRQVGTNAAPVTGTNPMPLSGTHFGHGSGQNLTVTREELDEVVAALKRLGESHDALRDLTLALAGTLTQTEFPRPEVWQRIRELSEKARQHDD